MTDFHNDEAILAERVHQLEEENEKLRIDMRHECDRLVTVIAKLKNGLRLRYPFWIALALAIGLPPVLGTGWLLYKWANSHATNICYITREQKQVDVYSVKRVVEWGLDATLNYSMNIQDATDATKHLGCKLAHELPHD